MKVNTFDMKLLYLALWRSIGMKFITIDTHSSLSNHLLNNELL